jgi:hypothetical protein
MQPDNQPNNQPINVSAMANTTINQAYEAISACQALLKTLINEIVVRDEKIKALEADKLNKILPT